MPSTIPIAQPTDLYLDAYQYRTGEEVHPHSSLWGDFNFSLDGILEFNIAEQNYLSPPNYGLWIPPQLEHQAISRYDDDMQFICLRISPRLAQYFPRRAKVIQISPFISTFTQHLLRSRTKQSPLQQWHKLQVLFDELALAPHDDQYLPLTHDELLKPILDFMLLKEHHALKLSAICSHFAMSERHLLRLAQSRLNMPISEWRNRAKLIYSMDSLKAGASVKRIALELGYQHPSAFIEFFKRYTQMTPEQFRKQGKN